MLVIKDLAISKEMTKQAMTAIFGGGHGCGNYDRTYSGRWRRTYYRSFYKLIRRGGRRYLALQKQWTFVRTQARYIGRLYPIRRVA